MAELANHAPDTVHMAVSLNVCTRHRVDMVMVSGVLDFVLHEEVATHDVLPQQQQLVAACTSHHGIALMHMRCRLPCTHSQQGKVHRAFCSAQFAGYNIATCHEMSLPPSTLHCRATGGVQLMRLISG